MPRERLLTPGEVAAILRVNPKTVTRWAHQGKLGTVRTVGGHHRFWEGDIDAVVAGRPLPQRDRDGRVIEEEEA